MPISVRDYLRLSSAGGLGGAGGSVTLTQVQTEATTAATAVKTELSDATTAGKGANLIAYTKLSGETGVVAPQYPVGDVRRYGARGDGNSRPLSTIYGTLSAAQAVYPHATALTDELDWAAIQSAVDNATVRSSGDIIPAIVPEGHYIIKRPIIAKNNVYLLGLGNPLIENINTTTSNTTLSYIFIIGNFHPQVYGVMAEYDLNNILPGNQITFSTFSQAGNLTVGVPFIIRSTASHTQAQGNIIPDFQEMHVPVSVNAGTGVVILEHSLSDPVTSPKAVPFDNQVDSAGLARTPVKNFILDGFSVKTNPTIAGWSQRWGMYNCTVRNIEIIDSRGFLVGNAACYSNFQNISGVFRNRCIELKALGHDSIFQNLRPRYVSHASVDVSGLPLVETGEAAHRQTIQNLFIDASGWNGANGIILDGLKNIFQTGKLVAPNVTSQLLGCVGSNFAGKVVQGNEIKDFEFIGGSSARYIAFGTTGAGSLQIPQNNVFQNLTFSGGITGTDFGTMEEGSNNLFINCNFGDYEFPVPNASFRNGTNSFIRCAFKNRSLNAVAGSYKSINFSGNNISNQNGLKLSEFRGDRVLAVSNTVADFVVAQWSLPSGNRPQEGDMYIIKILCNVTGTAGTKHIKITHAGIQIALVEPVAANTGPVIIDIEGVSVSNAITNHYVKTINTTGAMTISRVERTGLNVFGSGTNFQLRGWVDNAADALNFEMIDMYFKPLLSG